MTSITSLVFSLASSLATSYKKAQEEEPVQKLHFHWFTIVFIPLVFVTLYQISLKLLRLQKQIIPHLKGLMCGYFEEQACTLSGAATQPLLWLKLGRIFCMSHWMEPYPMEMFSNLPTLKILKIVCLILKYVLLNLFLLKIMYNL